MRTFLSALFIALLSMTVFTACEKPDYQDPRYRSSH